MYPQGEPALALSGLGFCNWEALPASPNNANLAKRTTPDRAQHARRCQAGTLGYEGAAASAGKPLPGAGCSPTAKTEEKTGTTKGTHCWVFTRPHVHTHLPVWAPQEIGSGRVGLQPPASPQPSKGRVRSRRCSQSWWAAPGTAGPQQPTRGWCSPGQSAQGSFRPSGISHKLSSDLRNKPERSGVG